MFHYEFYNWIEIEIFISVSHTDIVPLHSIDTRNTWNQDNALIIRRRKYLSVILAGGRSEIRSSCEFPMDE